MACPVWAVALLHPFWVRLCTLAVRRKSSFCYSVCFHGTVIVVKILHDLLTIMTMTAVMIHHAGHSTCAMLRTFMVSQTQYKALCKRPVYFTYWLLDGDWSAVWLQVGGLHPGADHRLGFRPVHWQDQGHFKCGIQGTRHREWTGGDRCHLGGHHLWPRRIQGQGPSENQVCCCRASWYA